MLGQVDTVYGHGPPSVASVPRTYTHPGTVLTHTLAHNKTGLRHMEGF